jgi:hypothetical protein
MRRAFISTFLASLVLGWDWTAHAAEVMDYFDFGLAINGRLFGFCPHGVILHLQNTHDW